MQRHQNDDPIPSSLADIRVTGGGSVDPHGWYSGRVGRLALISRPGVDERLLRQGGIALPLPVLVCRRRERANGRNSSEEMGAEPAGSLSRFGHSRLVAGAVRACTTRKTAHAA